VTFFVATPMLTCTSLDYIILVFFSISSLELQYYLMKGEGQPVSIESYGITYKVSVNMEGGDSYIYSL